MREPHFWRDLDRRSRYSAPALRLMLTPFSHLYGWRVAARIAKTAPFDPGIPVICIGNLTLGGAGKTPVTAEVRHRLTEQGLRAATLSRGYGGSEPGPLKVNAETHAAAQVGDEPLMLARTGESWIARDRVAGARAMAADGVEVIVMDDGHQNPTLKKVLSLVVMDASEPFGNRFVFPKGPLREPVKVGLARADAVVLMGENAAPPELDDWPRPILRAKLDPVKRLESGQYVAFAGIGRPERFFKALEKMEGVKLAEAVPYPDHHAFAAGDLDYLTQLAAKHQAKLVTTEKDLMRLPADFRARVTCAAVTAAFDNEDLLDGLIASALP